MQLRCTYCQTMFAISREEMLAALEHMEENNLTYYEAHCPKCRRGNRVERLRMERFFPDWKNAIKVMSKESAKTLPAEEKPTAAAITAHTEAPSKAPARHVKKHSPRTGATNALIKEPAKKTSSLKEKPAGTKKK
jgi:hypothetical protein